MEKKTSEKVALIDIGSNTIRTVVYCVQKGRFRKLYSERDYTSLITYVRDGRLTSEGLERLCDVLSHMRRFCSLCGCAKPIAFSTASLRAVTNRTAILSAVRKRAGMEIVQLTAEEEMACDCLGLQKSGVVEGTAFDLGGGSCQFFRFDSEGVTDGASMPFGCLSLGTHFVQRGLFPDHETAKSIRHFVRSALRDYLPGFEGMNPPVIYAMGGSARAAVKVLRMRQGEEVTGWPRNLNVEELRAFVKEARTDEGRMVALLRQTIPGRMSTLIPGMLAMIALSKYVRCETFSVSPVGVREGFLWKRM